MRHVPGTRRRSIFLKLLLVFAVSGIAINLMVFWGMRRIGEDRDPEGPLRRHLQFYGELLIREMGAPPDPAKIEAVEDRLDVRIRAESLAGQIFSGGDLPAWELLAAKRHPLLPGGIPVSRLNGRPFIQLERNGTRYIFFGPQEMAARQHHRVISTSIAALSLILLAAWFFLRRTLSPVKELAAGIERMSKGDLEVVVPTRGKGRDEFKMLVESFNSMVGRIREFIRSREQLLADVSHELRSPLTRMKVALEMIPPSAARDSVSRDVNEMEGTIVLILDSARFVSGQVRPEKKPLSLRAIVEQVVKLIPNAASVVDFTAVDPGIVASLDERWTKVVLRNVIENALTHGKPLAVDQDARIKISTERRKETTRICVQDSGPGMPADQAERVFEPFYRLDPSRQRATGGLGLGLHLSRRIMEAQGGAIAITSGQPTGTIVYIDFPAEN